jgi:hypothetical protein
MRRRTTAVAWLGALAVVLAVGGALAQGLAPISVNFDDMNPGYPPRGFTGGGPVKWAIEEEPRPAKRGKLLAERSRGDAKDRIAICLFDLTRPRDLEVQVAFRIAEGEVAQSAGLVLRAVDAANFYLVSADAKRKLVALSRVVGGIEYEVMPGNAVLELGRWHTLKVKAERDRLYVFLDGAKLFELYDERHVRGGRAGVATRADTLAFFDEFVLTPHRDRDPE